MKSITIERYTQQYGDRPGRPADAALLRETEREDLLLPPRPRVSHKYSYGRALIIAGARGYSGAAALSANACERGGAGLTQLVVPESIYPIAAARCDGAVVTPLPAAEDGGFSVEALPKILELAEKASAVALGPGLGQGEGARAAAKAVLRACSCPLVLDADGLNACADEPSLLDESRAELLLTPHEGEFKRLGGDLSEGRLAGALRFSRAHPRLTLILKGCGTLVCRGGEAFVNPTGGPALAKGGTGDVLCGLLCALLAQGMEPMLAARRAVYLHGLAGDLAAREESEYALAPSDLIAFLPRALRTLTGD